MNAHPDVVHELPLQHFFLPGLYARALFIPADTLTVSKIHKRECLSVMPKGERITWVDGRMQKITAPFLQITPGGFKRTSYTIKDSIWITLHPTDETDVAKLEAELVCDTEDEYLAFCRRQLECPS